MTRADVARYAGVSTAVVSYVMNAGPKPVAATTAARVRNAIDLLNYQPNTSARALRRGRTEMLGLVLSDSWNPLLTEFATAIGEAAALHGYAVMIGNSRGEIGVERSLVNDLIRRQVDGLIVASVVTRPDLNMQRPPARRIVWIGSADAMPGFCSIGCDGYAGARIAVDHLTSRHRHQHIGFIGPPPSSTDPRYVGWASALRNAGLPPGPKEVDEWSRAGGYAAGLRLIQSRNPPSAIFVASDLQAIGLLRAAHELRRRIPEDLAVIAFDGTRESEFSWPPLTVVAQPISMIAHTAIEQLLDPRRPEHHIQYQPHLITRRSCGCWVAPGEDPRPTDAADPGLSPGP